MNSRQVLNAMGEFSMLGCLNSEQLEYIIENSDLLDLAKNERVFEVGQESKEIFFLLDGVVKITVNTDDNREVIKTILHPKSILSEQSLACESQRISNATVMTTSATILSVNVDIIKELISRNPDLALAIINFLGRKLKYSEERLESLVLFDARERIVQFLKVNAQSFGQSIGYELLLRHDFTQQDIANFTGTSRQTVTTVLNDLKKTNKIHFKRKSILIRDIKALC